MSLNYFIFTGGSFPVSSETQAGGAGRSPLRSGERAGEDGGERLPALLQWRNLLG